VVGAITPPSVFSISEHCSPLFASVLFSVTPAFALVDTGASHSLLSADFARRPGFLPSHSVHERLVVADGRDLEVLGEVSVPFIIGDARLVSSFLVVSPLAYDALLGMDILTRMRASVVVHTRRLLSPLCSGSVPLAPLPSSPTTTAAPTQAVPPATPNPAATPPSTDPASDGLDPLTHEPSFDPDPPTDPDSLPLLADPLAFSDLLSAWDPKAWTSGCSTALAECIWPASHQALLNEYKDVFAPRSGAPGLAKVTPFRIRTTTDTPVSRRSRPKSPFERAIINKEVDTMLTAGIIKPSTSAYCSPVILVPKPDGTYRFCVDYRGLNKVTIPDKFPMPLARDIFNSLGGFAVFNTMDLAAGYFQIPIDPADCHKTAFACDRGLYEFTCLPFGVTNGPAVFCRVMSTLLTGLSRAEVSSFVDDLISPTTNETDSLHKLRLIFDRLRAAGFHLRLDKCRFGRKETKFLGHMLSASGLAVHPSNTESVLAFATPSSALMVRKFLGLAGYYRTFIADFAAISQPLFELTRKYKRFNWTPACETAFRTLQQCLTHAPVLAFPDFSRPFTIACDASRSGLGAILSQRFDEGERVISYASRQLDNAERRYTVLELEGLAVVWAIRYFHSYVFGQQFTIITDHRALAFLQSPTSELSDRMQRWLLSLQRYHFSIVYRPGSVHANVDALSRLPVVSSAFVLPDPVPLRASDIVAAQRTDQVLGPVYAFLESGQLPPDHTEADLVQARSACCSIDSLRRLCVDNADGSPRVWIPAALRTEVMRAGHDHMGHLGAGRTLARLRAHCYWETLISDVTNWCQSCSACAHGNKSHLAPAGLLQPLDSSGPFDLVVMDYMGPLPTSTGGNEYILVLMDHFSKWVEAIPVPAANGTATAYHLVDRIVCHWDRPRCVLSDNGKHFANHQVQALLDSLQIEYRHGLPYQPQTQGLVERFNGTLATMIRKHVSTDQTDWDVSLPWLLWSYNSSVQASTGFSPFEVLFGTPARAPLAALGPASVKPNKATREYIAQLNNAIVSTQKTVSAALEQARAVAKAQYDKSHRAVEYPINSLVMILLHRPRKGLIPKLQPQFTGPFQIIRKINDTTYEIRRPTGDQTLLVVPVRQMKRYDPRLPELSPSAPPQLVLGAPTQSAPLLPPLVHQAPVPYVLPDPVLVRPVSQPTAPLAPPIDLGVPVPQPPDIPQAVVPEPQPGPQHLPTPVDLPDPEQPLPDGHYIIDQIIGRRKIRNEPRYEYHVAWEGYDDTTWEDPIVSGLPQNLIDDYDRNHPFRTPFPTTPAPATSIRPSRSRPAPETPPPDSSATNSSG